jgi:small conductance mechanosensitive channel
MDPNVLLEAALPMGQSLLLALAVSIAGWMAAKWANSITLRSMRRAKVDEALVRFFSALARYTILAITVMAALGSVGIQTASLVAVFASAGLAVGLALQGSLGNFASGVMILFFRPFDLGDKVTLAGLTGDVVDIGLFACTLMQANNTRVIVPNAAVTGGTIENITAMGLCRGQIDIGIAYGSDLKTAHEALLRAARKCSLTDTTRDPHVAFVGFGASSLDHELYVWAKPTDYLGMLHEVRCLVYEELETLGIEIPYDQVVLHAEPGLLEAYQKRG